MGLRCIAILIAVHWLSGCGCTDVGCGSGLSVETGLDAHRIVVSDGGKDVRTCTKDEACWGTSDDDEQTALFYFAPKQLSVRIEDASGNVLAESTEQPQYDRYEPNGDDCPPTCKSATVMVD